MPQWKNKKTHITDRCRFFSKTVCPTSVSRPVLCNLQASSGDSRQLQSEIITNLHAQRVYKKKNFVSSRRHTSRPTFQWPVPIIPLIRSSSESLLSLSGPFSHCSLPRKNKLKQKLNIQSWPHSDYEDVHNPHRDQSPAVSQFRVCILRSPHPPFFKGASIEAAFESCTHIRRNETIESSIL